MERTRFDRSAVKAMASSSSSASAALEEEASFPMGYRFEPTSDELARYYLNNHSSPIPLAKAVHEIPHLDASDPWTLQDSYSLQRVDQCYFLTHRDYRGHRKANDEHGAWKPAGKVTEILDASGEHVCALRKPYKYFKNADSGSKETNWLMKEYSIAEPGHRDKKPRMEFQRVLCVIEKKEKKPEEVLCMIGKKKKNPEDQDQDRANQDATGDTVNAAAEEDRATKMSAEGSYQRGGGDRPVMLPDVVGAASRLDSFPYPNLHKFSFLEGYYDYLLYITREPDPQPSFTSRMNHHLASASSSIPVYEDLNPSTEEVMRMPLLPIDPWAKELMMSPSQASWDAGSTSGLGGVKEGSDVQWARLEEDRLPIGVRFSPTEEEIILYFLMKRPCKWPRVIHEVDVYEYDPWTLQM